MIYPRPIYIVFRLAEMFISSASRILNAAVFGGSTYQTTSARAHIDGMTSQKWARREKVINAIFFFQPNHCQLAWEGEVAAAQKTLTRAGV